MIDPTDLHRVLGDAVSGGAVPHAAAVVSDADGTRCAGAVGPRSVGAADPLTVDTPLRIASMTKPVATAAALRLVERGELDPATPVDEILPAFAELGVLDGFDGDVPRIRPPTARATVAQLATHTAGLGYWFWHADLRRWEKVTGTGTVFSGRREVFTAPLVADPGTRADYGVATDWLGLVVEEVSGRSLPDLLAERVLGPLGMAATSFTAPPGTAPVHRWRDGAWEATDIEWASEPEWWSAGHGLYSTPRDVDRFARMLLRGGELDGERVLRAETVDAMLTPQTGHEFPTHIPSAARGVAGPWDGPPGRFWGYGLLVSTRDEPGRRRAGSGGWAGIYNTFFWVDRAAGLAAGLYSQCVPFLGEGPVRWADDVEEAVYAAF